jgi:hypothetical protein
VQRIATERPGPAFYQSKASFIAQQTPGGERVGGVEPWRVQGCAARERSQTGRDEPAAHGDEEIGLALYASHIDVVCPKGRLGVRSAVFPCGHARHTSLLGAESHGPHGMCSVNTMPREQWRMILLDEKATAWKFGSRM